MNPDLWHWPQWTQVALATFHILRETMWNGEQKEPQKYNGSLALVIIAISTFILWSGGFYK